MQDAATDRLPPEETQVLDRWLFRSRESLEERFGMELERIKELYRSDIGKRELLEHMKQSDPSLNGNVDLALEQVNQNIDILKKKESFFLKMAKLPGRAVEAAGRTIKKHPVLAATAGVAALIALLYFTPALGPTAGEYGQSLIESFKGVLAKVNVAQPGVLMDAAGSVPVTGDVVAESVAAQAAESFVSPAEAALQNMEAIQAGQAAAGAAEATPGMLEQAADILSSPEVVEQARQAAEQSSETSPLQRILQNLPPLE